MTGSSEGRERKQQIGNNQRRWLKQQAHHLKPVVMLGQHGLTEAVLAEIELALDHHELIKVRIPGGDRDERDAVIAAIAARTDALLVQRIGNVAVYFRRNPKRKDGIRLPA
jgi:RNA-binding protein